jgi:hypothetical protein
MGLWVSCWVKEEAPPSLGGAEPQTSSSKFPFLRLLFTLVAKSSERFDNRPLAPKEKETRFEPPLPREKDLG